MMAAAWCCNCKEDFPVAAGEPYGMGALKPLSEAPPGIARQFKHWADDDEGAYLCGNCYFDILDAADEREG